MGLFGAVEGPNDNTFAVSITYASTQAFVDSQQCSHFLSCLSGHFPLRNIPHRPPNVTQNAIKTIQNLAVKLTPLSDELLKAKHKPETRHLVQANLLERPFVHLFLVSTTDSDAYRTQIRNDIRTWLNDLKETPSLNALPRSSGARPTVGGAGSAAAETEEVASKEAKVKDREDEGMPQYLIVYVTPPASSAPGTVQGSSLGYFPQSPATSSTSLGVGSGTSPGTPRDEQPVSTPKTAMSRFLSSSSSSSSKDVTGGVLDKLKTDFGGGRKTERSVVVSLYLP